jgi:hypothetical protein
VSSGPEQELFEIVFKCEVNYDPPFEVDYEILSEVGNGREAIKHSLNLLPLLLSVCGVKIFIGNLSYIDRD